MNALNRQINRQRTFQVLKKKKLNNQHQVQIQNKFSNIKNQKVRKRIRAFEITQSEKKRKVFQKPVKILIKSNVSSVASPNNQSPQRIFSPTKKKILITRIRLANQIKMVYQIRAILFLPSQIIINYNNKNKIFKIKIIKKVDYKKKFEKKSDWLFNYLNNQKNIITIEEKINRCFKQSNPRLFFDFDLQGYDLQKYIKNIRVTLYETSYVTDDNQNKKYTQDILKMI
ncbi:hypothetical protein TTHERM_000009876 (macronuclear) [Tetrahymena thermophila SB210]|uniref:Uncharacterized protein n=1 Tax=Tetrahymena thermophila (strain SB210) TaxID=312017 RepID=W7XLH9_TETTS|nr:hypothetical protein TTHERM_000009876 [Tetrahymena thermophila SB210]EWS76319.1 hypothetical protein TTHERM_000009876 [Tetrahymena thermophila SB210]|eukprot:XP_012651103.1 hypothetical protein TTHERM_000009876 [Tetrahymena thermophila SB210]